MGFWDARIASLEALGETFSPDELRVLEEGGEVLHLHPLEFPEYEVANWYTNEDGSAVLVPEYISTYGPSARANPMWGVPESGVTLAEWMDSQTHGGRPAWTEYPAYVGLLHDNVEEIYWSVPRSEELHPYLWLNCTPITSENRRLVQEVQMVSMRQINESGHHELGWYIGMWAEGDYPAEYPWLLVNHGPDLSYEERNQILREIKESSWNGWTPDHLEHIVKEQAANFEYLYRHKIIDADDERFRHGGMPADPTFTPLDSLLDAEGRHEAADFWRRLLARRRYALANLTGANYTKSPYLTPKEFWE